MQANVGVQRIVGAVGQQPGHDRFTLLNIKVGEHRERADVDGVLPKVSQQGDCLRSTPPLSMLCVIMRTKAHKKNAW